METALSGIDSRGNLIRDHVLQGFAIMPDLDKDVRLAVLKKLPELQKILGSAVTTVRKMHEVTLASNDKSQESDYQGRREARASIIGQLERDDLDAQTRMHLNDRLVQLSDKDAEKDSENKRYLDRWMTKATIGVTAAVVLTGVAIGGKVGFQGGPPRI
ncbi:hypothetical protein [Micromonospora robiginosa]|uniref:Uncharacterized protein n=1 Tax=Micromonospora robiginosa TaxID=2749844 RepID=A0A7L6BCE0_9ACTN|nr:hypothetical protein [Micromonospora ferruginea]QLQ39623.1 hypothetical protein H1D33_12805 [Micromonospora ferruginea]